MAKHSSSQLSSSRSGQRRHRQVQLLWHCGWCQPMTPAMAAASAKGTMWTTGMCTECKDRMMQRLSA